MSGRIAAALAPALAAGSGLALVAAHPPLRWWWTSFLAAPLLLAALTLDERAATPCGRGVRAFRLGLVAGVAAFAPMLHWVVLAVAEPTNRPTGYLGWSLLVLVQAAWIGMLAVFVRPALGHPSLPIVTAFAWTGVDAWRAIVPMNGFEWGAIAYAHVEGSWLLPLARIAGGRAITFLVVLISAAAFVLVVRTWTGVRDRGDAPVETSLRHGRTPAVILLGGLLVSVLATVEPPPEVGSLEVMVVQGNDVRHWEEDADELDSPLRITTAMRDLTVAAVEEGGRPDLTVWPESSIDRDPFSERGEALLPLIEEAAAASGALLAGANLDGPVPQEQFLNTAMMWDEDLRELDRYVKRRLVPFGEYVPYRGALDWFTPLEQVGRDAQPGPGPQAVTVGDGVRVAVIICFETLFDGLTRSNVLADAEPADLIVSITNDASFGDSAEPAQHLDQSRLRAVENGRWVVHGALSGSSAFVAPDGSVHQATDLFTRDTIRMEIPLVEGRTPFLEVGDLVGAITRVALIGLAAVAPFTAWRRRHGAVE